MSLPADIRIPDGYLEKFQMSSPPFDQPLSRRSRRASLVRRTRGIRGEEVREKVLKTHGRQLQVVREETSAECYCKQEVGLLHMSFTLKLDLQGSHHWLI